VVKMSLLVMAAFTLVIFMGLRWREERMAAARPAKVQRSGWLAAKKRDANRLVTAAALAVVATIALLGGLHWLRYLQEGW
jgi:hypothetical protein